MVMLKTGDWIRAIDIPKIFHDEEALSAVGFYFRFKKMGMPYGPWGMNPEKLVQIVDVVEPLDRFYHPNIF